MTEQPKRNLRCLHYLSCYDDVHYKCEKKRNHKGVHHVTF